MNNPAIKRLVKELQEIQNYKKKDDSEEDEDNFIEASPLKVSLFNCVHVKLNFIGRSIRMALHSKRPS